MEEPTKKAVAPRASGPPTAVNRAGGKAEIGRNAAAALRGHVNAVLHRGEDQYKTVHAMVENLIARRFREE